MHEWMRRDGIERLGRLARRLANVGVTTRETANAWKKDAGNAMALADILDYQREDGMPSAADLVTIVVHSTLPLIMFNYTPAALTTLHAFPHGWTNALRLCRGSIFHTDGRLVAHAFPKFFNYREHPETAAFPDSPFVATEKKDGHLGIHFFSMGHWRVTTRGAFESKSARIARDIMWNHRLVHRWDTQADPDLTFLTEIIDPSTRVHVDYRQMSDLVLIGAYDRTTLRDLSYGELVDMAPRLGIPVAERVEATDIEGLVALAENHGVQNREGMVVRFRDGLRVKLKFASYVSRMFEAKLSPTYVMRRLMVGDTARVLSALDFEIRPAALALLEAVNRARTLPVQERFDYLMGLTPEERRSDSDKRACRDFARYLEKTDRPASF